MDNNLINMISNLSKLYSNNNSNNFDQNQESTNPNTTASNNLSHMYPYGEFPIRYTKSGQEYLRRKSEERYYSDYSASPKNENNISNQTTISQKSNESNILNNLNLKDILPLISTLSNNKMDSNPLSMIKLLSPLLFKDNPDIINILEYIKPQSSTKSKQTNTLNTNRFDIDTLTPIE